MAREIRYQAAGIADGRLWLLRCQPHDGPAIWLLPGGGRKGGDSEQSCVEREVREETTLSVAVGPVLDDTPADPPDGTYTRWRTYACQVIDGAAAPGGAETAADLVAVRWLPLTDPASWEEELRADVFLYPQLVRIRAALGHAPVPCAAPAG